jgi:hypothetical protein
MNQHRRELTTTQRKWLVKTLDLAIGVRVPASQPTLPLGSTICLEVNVLIMKRVYLSIPIILLLCFCANGQSGADRGITHDGVYINPGFGFSYKYPKDWVVHGEATNERIREVGKEKLTEAGVASQASAEVALKNTYYLLTVFRHPVGTPGITFNPAILVIAEKVAHAPGITNGKDYLLNVRALLQKAGYQFPLNEPMEFRFSGRQFFRDDSTGEINGTKVVQSHFANVAKGYALVFIFLGQDQKSLDEMTKTMETFDTVLPVRRGVITVIGSAPQRKPN